MNGSWAGGVTAWSAAEGGGEGFFPYDLCEAEICHFNGEVFVYEKNVLGFDIPVDDVSFVLDSLS